MSRAEGNFLRGDIVKCVDDKGTLVAQGVINYSSDDARTIKGVVSERFSDVWGIWEKRSQSIGTT